MSNKQDFQVYLWNTEEENLPSVQIGDCPVPGRTFYVASHLHRNPPETGRVHLKEIKGNSQLAGI